MGRELADYLVDLAVDAECLRHFLRDPARASAEAGVGVEDQVLLRSGDAAALCARLAGVPAALCLAFWCLPPRSVAMPWSLWPGSLLPLPPPMGAAARPPAVPAAGGP